MKKIISRLGLLLTLLLMVVTLSACSSAASQKNVLQEDNRQRQSLGVSKLIPSCLG